MKLKYIIPLIFILVASTATKSQINNDSIFEQAIFHAQNQAYQLSMLEASKAYENDNSRTDILVFIANLYSWQEKNDSALLYLDKLDSVNYRGSDYYQTLTDVLLRSQKYEELLTACDQIQGNGYTNSEDLLRKRLIALTALNRFDEGVKIAELPTNNFLHELESIDQLYTRLLLKRNTNIVSATYALDVFNEIFKPQHLASLAYSFKLKNDTWLFRANYSDRFGMNGLQIESDYYLKLKNKRYIYLNYGYGFNPSLFPNHRLGFEYYFPLPKLYETSLGARFMNFPSSDVLIFTGHLAKYIQKSWFAWRPFYVYKLQTKTSSFSNVLSFKRYGKTEFNYWGLELGVGNSPDDIYSLENEVINQLNAYKIKFEYNFMLNKVSDMRLAIGYSKEEYNVTLPYRSRLSFDLGYKVRLK
jgi:YaiO family outer membrane protein